MRNKDKILKYFKDNEAYMNARINGGIEAYRKGDIRLVVQDESGNPVKCTLSLKQKNHHFKFGANIFMLDEFECEEKNKIYREKFAEALNLATVPIYWNDLEPEEGKPRFKKNSPKIYRRPALDLCIEYCEENGIEPKAHCLNYDNFKPDWLTDPATPYYKKKLEERFKILAENYADKIPSWEVTNETFLNLPEWQYKHSKFYHEDDFVEWSFKTADKYFPNNHLIINDFAVWGSYHYGNRSPYFMQIERLNQNPGLHLDSIGMQLHTFEQGNEEENSAMYKYNPLHLYDVLDTYYKLGKKLQITEMTLSANGSSAEDEEIQCEVLKNLYSIFFSHPAMEAIIYWNLVDGYAAFAKQGDMTQGENRFYGGLLRHDLSEKPAYTMLKKLVNEVWHTEIKDLKAEGEAKLRGFYGEYEVEIKTENLCITKTISVLPEKVNSFTFKL